MRISNRQSTWCNRVKVLLAVVMLYTEPLVVGLLGRRCAPETGGGSDLLISVAYAPIEAVQAQLALRTLLLLAWDGFFWFTLWRFAYKGGWRYRDAWGGMCLFSLVLHLVHCSHRDKEPVGTGLVALDALLSPVTVSRNAFFAPRLAWATMEWNHGGSKPWQWTAWVIGGLFMGTVLYQQETRDWCFLLATVCVVFTPELSYVVGRSTAVSGHTMLPAHATRHELSDDNKRENDRPTPFELSTSACASEEEGNDAVTQGDSTT